jgi:ABC exporter DevB family membrane fusion protein
MTRILAVALLIALAACDAPDDPPAAPAAVTTSEIAAGGLIEPIGEERVLIPETGGRLARVLIDEGDTVEAGELLAEIDNAAQQARVMQARAELARAEATLARLVAGPRREERAEATAAWDEARVAAAQAEAEAKRREDLYARQLIGLEARDQARTAASAAAARERVAAARAQLLAAGTRSEDLAAGRAAVDAANGLLAEAEAALEKTRIRSPIDGVVLKRDLREGETVVALSPIPLARIGDLSRLHVRVDIDEIDIARVSLGQRARITSDAFPGVEVGGEVIGVSQRMGRRNAVSDSPTERVDANVLEVDVRLDEGASLPVGLRVDVRIDTGARSN